MMIKSLTVQIESIEKNTNAYTGKMIRESELKYKKEMDIVNEKFIEVRMENNKYAINLQKMTNEINVDYDKLLNIKTEIFQNFDIKYFQMKSLHDGTLHEFEELKIEYDKMKMKFNELSDYIREMKKGQNSNTTVKDTRRLSNILSFSETKNQGTSSNLKKNATNNDSVSMDENNSSSQNINKNNFSFKKRNNKNHKTNINNLSSASKIANVEENNYPLNEGEKDKNIFPRRHHSSFTSIDNKNYLDNFNRIHKNYNSLFSSNFLEDKQYIDKNLANLNNNNTNNNLNNINNHLNKNIYSNSEVSGNFKVFNNAESNNLNNNNNENIEYENTNTNNNGVTSNNNFTGVISITEENKKKEESKNLIFNNKKKKIYNNQDLNYEIGPANNENNPNYKTLEYKNDACQKSFKNVNCIGKQGSNELEENVSNKGDHIGEKRINFSSNTQNNHLSCSVYSSYNPNQSKSQRRKINIKRINKKSSDNFNEEIINSSSNYSFSQNEDLEERLKNKQKENPIKFKPLTATGRRSFNIVYFIRNYSLDAFEKNEKEDFLRKQKYLSDLYKYKDKHPFLHDLIFILNEFNKSMSYFKGEFIKKITNTDQRIIQIENFWKKKMEELAFKIKNYLPITFNPYIKNYGNQEFESEEIAFLLKEEKVNKILKDKLVQETNEKVLLSLNSNSNLNIQVNPSNNKINNINDFESNKIINFSNELLKTKGKNVSNSIKKINVANNSNKNSLKNFFNKEGFNSQNNNEIVKNFHAFKMQIFQEISNGYKDKRNLYYNIILFFYFSRNILSI